MERIHFPDVSVTTLWVCESERRDSQRSLSRPKNGLTFLNDPRQGGPRRTSIKHKDDFSVDRLGWVVLELENSRGIRERKHKLLIGQGGTRQERTLYTSLRPVKIARQKVRKGLLLMFE